MPRTKGSKNKPKFTQLGLGLEEVPDTSYLKTTYGVSDNLVVGDTYPSEVLKDMKFKLNEVTNNMEITHALRTINQGNFAEIEQSFKEKFFDNGWKLFATHYIGQISEGIMILYILIREQ